MGNDYSKQGLTTSARAATARIKIRLNKKRNLVVQVEREVSNLIKAGKLTTAKIKAETLIRDENYMQCMEWVQTMCDLVNARVNLIDSQKKPPRDLMPQFCTIMYCSTRMEIDELTNICKCLVGKYGKEWQEWVKKNAVKNELVDVRIIDNLSPRPPTQDRVNARLTEVAKKYGVKYEDADDQKNANPTNPVYQAANGDTIDQQMVERAVGFLMEPSMNDYSEDQKRAFLANKGAQPAEIAAALEVVRRRRLDAIAQQNVMPQYPSVPAMQPSAPQAYYPPQNPAATGYPHAAQPAPAYPSAQQPGFGPPPGGNTPEGFGPPPGGNDIRLPSVPTGDVQPAEGGGDDDMDDLEARFRRLQNGM